MGLIYGYYNRQAGLKAVELKDFKPPQILRDVLDHFWEAGFENPILHGGALRDAYLGRPFRDIDVATSVQEMKYRSGPFTRQPEDSDEDKRPVFFANRFIMFHPTRIEGIPHEIDLKDMGEPIHLRDFAMYSDVTMNGIAMDVNGRVMVHPRFEHDAKNNIFRPASYNGLLPALAMPIRYVRLASKFPDMKLRFG